MLTINALVASREVLVPVQAEYYALEGLAAAARHHRRWCRAAQPGLRMLGVLLTMIDGRTT